MLSNNIFLNVTIFKKNIYVKIKNILEENSIFYLKN